MRDFSSRIALVVAFLVIFGFGDWFHHSALALDLPKRLPGRKYHPQMESVLAMLRDKYIEGRAVAETFSRKRQIPFRDDEVTVVLVPPEDEDPSVIDQADLRSWGAKVEAVSRHLLRASVPVSNLDKVADKVAGISYIRLPLTPLPAEVRSEGVELINALAYHNSGYLGQNTKVAIIDLGFERLAAAQADGDIPYTIISKDFTGEGLSTGTTHGTDMTEIVHDVAPEAQLYLIKIADEVDLENAKDYCVSEGVDIINHSWAWFNTNFTDGTGLVCSIADDARSSGILWVNAAGNWAEKHYQDFFLDSDDDGWHDFSPGDETNIIQTSSGEDIEIYLTWNDWPTTSQDYDLYLFTLFGSDLVPVADSTNRQTGTQPPTESIILQNALPNTYYIAIYRYNATEDKELKIFSFSHSLQYQTPAHSLSAPADAAGATAVAAIDQVNWYTGPQEGYSSQGPTTDGRTKPDISGPTNVATFTSGRQGGTSGATPHVTGAASLLLSRYPGLAPDQIEVILEGCAVDMGNVGKDSIYGSGRLNLFLNTPPILSWTGEPNYVSDGLDPDKGNTSTQFVYRVMYNDLDNDAPKSGYPKVHILKEGSEISNSPFTMDEVDTRDTTYTDGKLYTYTRTDLATGTDYSYYFEAKDQSNAKASGAPTIETSGPDRVLSVNLASLIVYPNPFSPGKGHTQIIFDRLTPDATIRIFNLSGEEVFREDVSWQMSWSWNVKNKQGEAVVRGVYVYLVTNSMGEKKLGKIAVIE